MADFIKCTCGKCGARYRLPVEFQGRKARCKKCGEKFEVPRVKSIEDSVLDWLSEAEEEEAIAEPKVISIPKEQKPADDGDKPKRQGIIRLKETPTG